MKFSESTLKASVWAGALKVTRVVVAAIAALLICYPVLSQGNQGTIQGGVFDQSGGAIAGATVTIVDASRGVSRPLTTDSAGAYVGTNLTPGTYTVRAEAKGFQTVEHPNVLVEVGRLLAGALGEARPPHVFQRQKRPPFVKIKVIHPCQVRVVELGQ